MTMSDRRVLFVAVASLVMISAGVAVADYLTRSERRFLRAIGCTPAVLEKNKCQIDLIDTDGPAKPRNMMLNCEWPLYIKPKQSCLTNTCQ